MEAQLGHSFEEIISVENLLAAWKEFIAGKRNKPDVEEFSLHLTNHIFALHDDLANQTYQHGGYHAFKINDPKPRDIHKASVRDRLLHHAIYRMLYPFFDRTFIADSYSCRLRKGTHKALNRFRAFGSSVGKNNTRTCWVLKMDIKKFFANIDQEILLGILQRYIPDRAIVWLLQNIIASFSSGVAGRGLPLGNLTSQLLVNIYMNEFDQFVKHHLHEKYYVRYADDFVIFSHDRDHLVYLWEPMGQFLYLVLGLRLHPRKVEIKTLASGVDFLGWVHFPDHRVLRTRTKQRMLRRVHDTSDEATIASYLGLLRHGNTQRLKKIIYQQLDRARENQ